MSFARRCYSHIKVFTRISEMEPVDSRVGSGRVPVDRLRSDRPVDC